MRLILSLINRQDPFVVPRAGGLPQTSATTRPEPAVILDAAIPLDRLPAGHHARVAAVLGAPEHVHRLAEIGLCPGRQLEMIRPGCPCIVRLGGMRLCLRCDDALSVLVGPGHAPPAVAPPAVALPARGRGMPRRWRVRARRGARGC